MRKILTVVGLWCLLLFGGTSAQGDVANTAHNLSATGPGKIKAPGVTQVCIFCHVPHRAASAGPLWNRDLPARTYNIYTSSTLEATLKQPTGASRLCLSCHDGTTALGALREQPRSGAVGLGALTGRAALGTDLSDDHPISFVYDTSLSLKQTQLADPRALQRVVPLDGSKQMQCTSCHDPHEDRYRKFLRIDDRASSLCNSCHKQKNWAASAHATSPATWRGSGATPWGDSPYKTVSDNGCRNCHKSHGAARPPRLLNHSQEHEVCLVCHNGSVANKNLAPEFLKSSAHPVMSSNWTHDPRENPNTMPRHVTCVDCHNPHQTPTVTGGSVKAGRGLQGVKGVNISGAIVSEATEEYNVCLKCHGTHEPTSSGVERHDNIRSIRAKINPSNGSFHPVAAPSKRASLQGLEAQYSGVPTISCTDCHNNDDWTSGGNKARGPHGSRYSPILEREYQMEHPAMESFQTYALCYKCHNRDYLINDRARTFPHKKHIVDGQTPCAACHDAHGSRQNSGLINFMRRDRLRKKVVNPSNSQKRVEFISLGQGRGQCYLECHGVNHEPKSYP